MSGHYIHSAPTLVYLLRPNNMAIWLEEGDAKALGAKHGDKLTPEQFNSQRVQGIIRAREAKQPKAQR